MSTLPPTRVVIIGAGFGGLAAARALARHDVAITLIDARNHHLFQPLLYQVATAGLSPADIAAPIRGIVSRQRRTRVLLGEAQRVDAERKRVVLGDGSEVPYDYLIVAAGMTHSYFGHEDEWAAHAPGLKTIEDALEIRRRVLFAFEKAERTSDPEERQALLTFAVVGGGPTGVELAGALAELSRHTLVREFRSFDPRQTRVILCEGGPRVLGTYPPDLCESAQRQLEKLGVEVLTERFVTAIDERGLTLGEERIEARTVLWAAGVRGVPLAESLGTPLDRAGRVKVKPDLSLPEHHDVFVIGDLTHLPLDPAQPDGELVPGVAPAAMQMGKHAARQIKADLRHKPRQDFKYLDKGSMATIGRASAVALLAGGLKLTGYIAWLAWLFVHLIFLVGFRNQALVLFQWAWAYFTFERGARLITESVDEPGDAQRPDPQPEPQPA